MANSTPTADNALGRAVRDRRRALGLRQGDLAELAGCSQKFLSTLEQGKPALRLDKVLDVLAALGLGFTVGPGRGEIRSLDPDSERPGS